MKKIGIIVAMDKEFAQLRTLLSASRVERLHGKAFVVGTIGHAEVVMEQCGIGKVNAAIGAVELIDSFRPDLVISTGVAGGADASLRPLDVVVGAECTYHDVYCGQEVAFGQLMGMPARYAAPSDLVEMARSLPLPEGMQLRSGLTVSGDWFVDSREKMREILDRFPEAEAVDMESCAIAQTCYVRGVPFVSFRIISDVPLRDDKAAQYYDFWSRLAEGSFEVTRLFIHRITQQL